MTNAEGMAQEVDLSSLQDLERNVVLQVLYRDQAVRHIEEERIRYAGCPGRALLSVLGISYWGLLACAHCWLRSCSFSLPWGLRSEKGRRHGQA